MDRDIGFSGSADPQQAQNDYYRAGFRTMMRIVNIQALVIFALVFLFIFYVNTAEDRDRYFATTSEGRKMQMAGLNLPNMGRTALTNWVAQAAGQIMTFGFNDVDERFELSKANFTPQGWESFREAMISSGLIDNVINAQQIVTSVPIEPPVLLWEGLVRGKYNWSFETKLLITFRAGGVKTSRTRTVQLTLETLPTRDNPNGVGISEWNLH